MKQKKPRRALMTLITVLIILLVAAIIYFCLTGFGFGVYRVDPIQEQVNLGLDLTGGVYAVYQADQGDLDAGVFKAKLDATMDALRHRLDKKGFTEASVVAQGSDRIRVEVPINDTTEMQDPSKILEFLGKPAKLEFLDENGEVAITGDMVTKSEAATTQSDFGGTEYVVSLEFNSEGSKKFEELTTVAYEKGITIPITLDGKVISDPMVEKGPISGGSAIIEGNMTAEQANDLAIQIESGALPLNLKETEVRSINASLGDDALNKSLFAGFVGLCILFLFMIVYYRMPGLMACIALSFYLFIVVFLLAAIPAIQLTLPGIAGIILGIGMAVDSNVIIFERFKEELAVGKTLRSSLNSGFSKALRTIIDSNVTTFIAAIVIAIFGVGSVKGFGYTLMISIVVSMFTALVITRLLLKFIIYLNIKNRKLYTIRKPLQEAEAKGGE